MICTGLFLLHVCVRTLCFLLVFLFPPGLFVHAVTMQMSQFTPPVGSFRPPPSAPPPPPLPPASSRPPGLPPRDLTPPGVYHRQVSPSLEAHPLGGAQHPGAVPPQQQQQQQQQSGMGMGMGMGMGIAGPAPLWAPSPWVAWGCTWGCGGCAPASSTAGVPAAAGAPAGAGGAVGASASAGGGAGAGVGAAGGAPAAAPASSGAGGASSAGDWKEHTAKDGRRYGHIMVWSMPEKGRRGYELLFVRSMWAPSK